MTKQTLGELNGRWTVLFKVVLAIIPFCVLGLGWTYRAVGSLNDSVGNVRIAVAAIQANRFTSEHGLEVWKEIAAIRETIAALPPDRFEDKVDELAKNQQLILQELAVLKERLPK